MDNLSTDNPHHRRNAMILTLRMMIAIAVGFYTSRLVLSALGIDDFGIVGVISAIVGTFSFINSSLTESSSRFIACEINSATHLHNIFSNALTLHLIYAILLPVVAIPTGLLLIRYWLTIPHSMTGPASFVLVLASLSAALSVVRGVYAAAVTAHEKMSFYAIVESINVSLRLGVAVYVSIAHEFKLETYALLSLLCEISVTAIYIFYCKLHFSECRDQKLRINSIKKMALLSGWDLSSRITGTLTVNATDVCLNIFFGLGYSAAVALCRKVAQAATNMAGSPAMAFKPAIFKHFASDDIREMTKVMTDACRLCIPLTCMITVPVFLCGDRLLCLWLDSVPAHTTSLLPAVMAVVVLEPLLRITSSAVMATGRIKLVSILNGSITSLSFAASFIVLKNWQSPLIAYLIPVPCAMTCIFFNLLAANRTIRQFDVAAIVHSAFWSYCKCVPGVIVAVVIMKICGNIHILANVALTTATYVAVTAMICRSAFTKAQRPIT